MIDNLLSDQFFETLKNVVMIGQMVKNERSQRVIPVFRKSIKKRLLILNEFQYSKMDNFDLKKNMRFQYVLENFLQYEIDESIIQKLVDFLMMNHQRIIFNVTYHKTNFQLIKKNLHQDNYIYLEVLSEILETVKFNAEALNRVREYLDSLCFVDFIIYVTSKFEFVKDGDKIVFDTKDIYYKNADNMVCFLQTVLTYIKAHKGCQINPNINDKDINVLLKFLFSIYFHNNSPKINILTLQILCAFVKTNHEGSEEGTSHHSIFVQDIIQSIEGCQTTINGKLFKLIDALLLTSDALLIIKIIVDLSIMKSMIMNINFRRNKRLASRVLRIISFVLKYGSKYIDNNEKELLVEKLSHSKVFSRTNMQAHKIHWLLTRNCDSIAGSNDEGIIDK